MRRTIAVGLAVAAALVPLPVAHAGLRETVHNLSPGGAGRQASGGATTAGMAGGGDLCVFCHTPHSASGQRGLWNRSAPPLVYKLYESSTSEADLQQPTGSSRLCLSCHDGMVAVGAMRQHGDPSLGKLTGSSVLGTDLSDDHPISFVYDSSLVARRRQLANPHALSGPVKLDETGQVQCTACHDAHLDRYPRFLVMDPAYSSLCTTCHQIPHWPESAHATSSAATAAGNEVWLGFATVGQNGCSSCHRSHGAPHPEFLLGAITEEGVCLTCHDGRVAQSDLRREFNKPSAHRIDRYGDLHDPTENPNTMPRHVECVDCHDSHQARGATTGEILPGPLYGASGLAITGSFTREAGFEYEVCLKCHGVAEEPDPIVFRDDAVTNTRLEIDPGNPSFHPVADIGRNPDVPGLISPLSAASRTPCTSCHGNDAAAGGAAPRGPHGSRYRPILAAEYHLDAITAPESYQRYALCYGCHDRNTLLNRSAGFPHRLHVDEVGASCAVCHDAHGSRQSPHLINFMLRDYTGAAVVTASSSGLLAYDSLGVEAGRCSLTCHAFDHDALAYPERPGGVAPAPLRGQRR